jgi:hypothetical protein
MRKLWKKINVTAVVAAVLAVTMVFSAFAAFETPTFTDVPKSHWAYTFIETAAGKGWVSGTGGGKFEPTKNLTNAEFVTMLVNAWYPDDYAEIKPNVGSAYWWTPYLHTASVVGMLMNTEVGESYFENDLEFPASAANTKISRYEMALMIANVMKQKKITVDSGKLSAAPGSIADYGSIPEKYKDAVTTCFAAGVLSGKGEGKFAGQDNLTRAESAAVLCNIYKLFSSEDLTGGSGTTTPVNPDPVVPEEPEQPEQPIVGRDTNGYTTAASVNSVNPKVGKSDDYKTKGRADTPNKNGYYTAANVDFGDAKLVYEFLDMVNEARVAEGLSELTWTELDAFEEYTLLRAYELTVEYSHERPGYSETSPGEKYSFLNEIIAKGFDGNTQKVFEGWMNSSGHKRAIMGNVTTMCAAKCRNHWIITFGGNGSIGLIEGGALVDYEHQNGWLTD